MNMKEHLRLIELSALIQGLNPLGKKLVSIEVDDLLGATLVIEMTIDLKGHDYPYSYYVTAREGEEFRVKTQNSVRLGDTAEEAAAA
ncbi:MAG: hypothetical protein EOP06_03725, partial [Proteobacteria bacterium]